MPSLILGKQKPSKLIVAGLATLMAIIGIYIVVFSHAAPSASNLANAWVDPNGGTCAYHAQAAAWVDGEGCTSIDQALGKVASGDTVRVKAGTSYGAQNITTNKTSTTYVIAENGTTIGSFSPAGNYVEYQNFTAANMDLEDKDVQHVTLRNVNTGAQGAIVIDGPDYFTWIGGTIGPYQLQASDWDGRFEIQGSPGSTSNIILDGLIVSPTTRSAAAISAGKHTETMRFNGGVNNVMIRNFTFLPGQNINSATIFIGGAGFATNETNLTFENNFFGQPSDGQPLIDTNGQGAACNTYIIQYNTNATNNNLWTGGSANCTSQANVTVRGNLGKTSSSCGNAVYDNNVWSNFAGCGGGDLGNQTIALTGDGYHIPSNSPARGNGSSTICPATDHDGDTRPTTNCDAGADQYSSGTNPPPPPPPPTCTRAADINCDGSVNILDVTVVLSNFGKPAAQATEPRADASGNGTVDIPDLTVVLSAFGS
jgi:hypothetical protein